MVASLPWLHSIFGQQYDPVRRIVGVGEYGGGRNAVDMKTFVYQPGVSCCIFLEVDLFTVNATIDFDNQLRFAAIEVSNVRTDRFLPAEHRLSRHTSF